METKIGSSINRKYISPKKSNLIYETSKTTMNDMRIDSHLSTSSLHSTTDQILQCTESAVYPKYLMDGHDPINKHTSPLKKEATLMHSDTIIRRTMLTTLDNPFNPFDDFDSWFAFDESNNYNSCSYLARIAKTSDELSEIDNELAIEQAIDEIIELNILGIYKKVVKEIKED